MTKEQRDQILTLCKKSYELLGCVFPSEEPDELVEYLYESSHGDEQRALAIAIEAHNLYNGDDMDDSEFFDWHGL